MKSLVYELSAAILTVSDTLFSSRSRRRRKSNVPTLANCVSIEKLDARQMLSGNALTESIPQISELLVDDADARVVSDTKIQQQKFIIRASNNSGHTANNGFVVDKDAESLRLEVFNGGENRGARVSFESVPGKLPFGTPRLPRDHKIPALSSRIVEIPIPQGVNGRFGGTLVLQRFGANTTAVRIPVSAVVGPELKARVLAPRADASRIYFDIEIRNTGNGDGLKVNGIAFTSAGRPAIGWNAPSLEDFAPLPKRASRIVTVAADIDSNTDRIVSLRFESNSIGTPPLATTVDSNDAFGRLAPVAKLETSVAPNISAKSIDLQLQVHNHSIRDTLVVNPSEIQLADRFGRRIIDFELVSGSGQISLLPGTKRILTLRLRIDRPDAVTDSYRLITGHVPSNDPSGTKSVSWDASLLIERLRPTLKIGEFSYSTWNRTTSQLKYTLTILNDSIRDELVLDLRHAAVPQHVSINHSGGSILRLGSGKSAIVQVEIFTDVPAGTITDLKRFELSFASNDPRGRQSASVYASALEHWKDTDIRITSSNPQVGVFSFLVQNTGDRSVEYSISQTLAPNWTWHLPTGVVNGRFTLKPGQITRFTAVYSGSPYTNSQSELLLTADAERSHLNRTLRAVWSFLDLS